MATGATTPAHSAFERRAEDLALVFHLLPAAVQDMADRLGASKALRIAAALSGLTVDIPKGQCERAVNALRNALGSEELAADLMAAYGGEKLYLPNCARAERAVRDIEIHRAAEAGLANGRSMNTVVDSLAQKYRLSDRRIWGILKKPPPTLLSPPSGGSDALRKTTKTTPETH